MTIKGMVLADNFRLQFDALRSDQAQITASINALATFQASVESRFGELLGELTLGEIRATNAQRTNYAIPIQYRGIRGTILFENHAVGYDLAIQFPDPPGGLPNTWSRVSDAVLDKPARIAVWLENIANRINHQRSSIADGT